MGNNQQYYFDRGCIFDLQTCSNTLYNEAEGDFFSKHPEAAKELIKIAKFFADVAHEKRIKLEAQGRDNMANEIKNNIKGVGPFLLCNCCDFIQKIPNNLSHEIENLLILAHSMGCTGTRHGAYLVLYTEEELSQPGMHKIKEKIENI